MPASLGPSLDRLARIAIEVGINLQPGQPLGITAPLAARGFVHRLAKAAYRAGGGLVTCSFEDPGMIRLALTDMDLGHAAAWRRPAGTGSPEAPGVATLRVAGPLPSLVDGVPVDRVLALHALMGPESAKAPAEGANTCTMPFVTRDWATAVRPDLPGERGVEALWHDVFVFCGADSDDSADRLSKRLDRMARGCEWLNGLHLGALRLVDEGTDLHMRPLAGAQWSCSRQVTVAGIGYLTELPPGAVRIPLDPAATHGILTVVQPLRIAGAEVCGLRLEFEAGRVARCEARRGQEAIQQLLDTDDGAARLGAVGLVERSGDASDPPAGFMVPALNRASRVHVTFGAADPVPGGGAASSGENQSALCIDAPAGTQHVEVFGRLADGTDVPLLKNQTFLFV